MTFESFVQLLDQVRHTSRGFVSRCPGHRDQSPSLSLREAEDGRILLHCFAQCDVHQICAALGLEVRDLYPDGQRDSQHIRAAQEQRQRREHAQHRVHQLKGAEATVQREADALIRASSLIPLEQLSDGQLDKYLHAIAAAHKIMRLEMGEQDYAEWSCRLGERDHAVANS